MVSKGTRVLLCLVAALGSFGAACALAMYAPARAPGSVVGKAMCVAGLALIGVGLVRWACRARSKPDRGELETPGSGPDARPLARAGPAGPAGPRACSP
jgi:hypothetical protein